MEDLSLHILDIMQNSTAAGATRLKLLVTAGVEEDLLSITIEDNGCGMSEQMAREALDPFTTSRTTRKVGLGLPLLKASAEGSEGKLEILSEQGAGTRVTASFRISSIDRPPLGDVAVTVTNMIISEPGLEYEVVMRNATGTFSFNTREIKERLGEVPISEYAVLSWIEGYLDQAVKEIFGGVLDEVDSRFGGNKEENPG